MKRIKLTQGKYAIVDKKDFHVLNKFKWYAVKDGGTFYARRNHRIDEKRRTVIFMHQSIMRTPKGFHTDHINHDGLDNRRKNLRVVTASENRMNTRGLDKNNTSGFFGVYWHKLNKHYQVQIRSGGKKFYIGAFATAEEAAKAYDRAAKKLHGEYARQNFG